MYDPQIGENELCVLRNEVEKILSPRRFAHTIGVENAAARLAELYCPDKKGLLRGGALLHDITKEKDENWHRAALAAHGIMLRPDEEAAPAIWHGISAAAIIGEKYSRFALPELVSAVRWHTTGRAGMSLVEALLYFADYIEEGRTYGDCVAVRNDFFGRHPESLPMAERLELLAGAVRSSLDLTLAHLAEKGGAVSRDSAEALLWLTREKHPFERK